MVEAITRLPHPQLAPSGLGASNSLMILHLSIWEWTFPGSGSKISITPVYHSRLGAWNECYCVSVANNGGIDGLFRFCLVEGLNVFLSGISACVRVRMHKSQYLGRPGQGIVPFKGHCTVEV